MARILGGGGKMPSQTVGRPGYRSLKAFGAPRKRVGLVSASAQKGVRRLLRRDPSKFQGDAPFGGPLTAATLTTAMAGADNDIKFTAQQRGNSGNSVRVRIVVAGASTVLSVSVSGSDITINSATNSGSAATSTAAQVIAAVNASSPAKALVYAELKKGDTGTGVVAAFGFTTLAGGVVPDIQGGNGTPNPNVVKAPVDQSINLANARGKGSKNVIDKSKNRSVTRRGPVS